MIQAKHLSKRFGDFWAVRDLSLSLERGEIYSLLGPNGAGKTTTLRMIAGLIEPDEGAIHVDGIDLHKDPQTARKQIGFLTGNTGLYQRLNPIELLTFFGRLNQLEKGHLKRQIDTFVDMFGIGEFKKKLCGTLSTGQKQRVNIARALLHDPTILILDEPTAGLDIISSEFILQTIRRCKDEGRTILFSTHILTETELLSDRIGVVHRGHLAEEGTLEQILKRHDAPNLARAFLQIVQGVAANPIAPTPTKELT